MYTFSNLWMMLTSLACTYSDMMSNLKTVCVSSETAKFKTVKVF